MNKDGLWKQAARKLATYLLLFNLLLLPLSVQAQQDTSTLYVQNVNGTKLDNGAVFITGQVVNPYPWDAANVDVTVIFDRDPTLYSTTTVDLVPKGTSVNFTISKLDAGSTNTFITLVTRFNLMSDDVNALLKLHGESDSLLVQDAVQNSFPLMSEKALPELLDCIDTSLRGESYDPQQNVNDLICLGGLRALAKDDGVRPLLQLLSWYETKHMVDLPDIKASMFTDQYSSLWYMPILDGFDPLVGTFDDLIVPILIKIGPAGVPELVDAQSSGTPLAQQAAQTALVEIDGTLMQALGEETDAAKLIDVINALGALGKGETVPSLLEIANKNPNLAETASQSIKTMGVAAFPGLIETLAHPKQAIADHAKQLLLVVAGQYPTEFLDAVQTEIGAVPDGNVEGVIEELRQQADQLVNQEIAERFSQAWSEYQKADCDLAYRSILGIQEVFAGRPIFSGREKETAQIYSCKARSLAQNGDLELALSIGEISIRLDSQQGDLVKDLESWSVLQIQSSIQSNQWENAHSLIEDFKLKYPDNPVANDLESELFYAHYRWLLIAISLVVLSVFIFMIVQLVRRQNFTRRFRQVLADTNQSTVQAFNAVYAELEEGKRRKFLDEHLTNDTAENYSQIARYDNTLGKDALSSILNLPANSRIKTDKQVDMLAGIVLNQIINGWQRSLEKLIKINEERAWDCSKKLLFTKNKTDAVVICLSKKKGKAYNNAIDNLFKDASHYPVQSRTGLVTLLGTDLQHRTRDEIEAFLKNCLELSVPDSKALYALNTEESLAAWQSLLAQDDGKLSQRWEQQLQSARAPFHADALATALKIANTTASNRKKHFEPGVGRMHQILVRAMLHSEDSIAPGIGREMLGILGRESLSSKIITELKKENLQSLLPLLDADEKIRQVAMDVIRSACKSPELKQGCLDLLTKTFHAGSNAAAADAFNMLVKPGDPRYDTEIEWAVSHGKAHHAKLLLNCGDDDFQQSVISRLVETAKGKNGKRVSIVYDWIKDYSSTSKITLVATTLLGLSILDRDKTLQQWQQQPGRWSADAVRLAMGQPDSPLPEIILEWCHHSDEKMAAKGVHLLAELACE